MYVFTHIQHLLWYDDLLNNSADTLFIFYATLTVDDTHQNLESLGLSLKHNTSWAVQLQSGCGWSDAQAAFQVSWPQSQFLYSLYMGTGIYVERYRQVCKLAWNGSPLDSSPGSALLQMLVQAWAQCVAQELEARAHPRTMQYIFQQSIRYWNGTSVFIVDI